ncbi:MAG: hypothetical protein WCK86_11420 [Planctomycetia bacterium]
MLQELRENPELRHVFQHLDVWEWPSAMLKPRRDFATADGEWVIFGPRGKDLTLELTGGGLNSAVDVSGWFVKADANVTQVSPPDDFWRTVESLNHVAALPMQVPREIEGVIFESTIEELGRACSGKDLAAVLGTSKAIAKKRRSLCWQMLGELQRSESGVSQDSLNTIIACSLAVAKLLNIGCAQPSETGKVRISLGDVIGFLLCWR